MTSLLAGEELLDHRGLAGLFGQKTVVPVWCVDDAKLDLFSRRAQRLGELLGISRRVQPIRTERDQQRPRRNVPEGFDETPAPVLPRQIEVRQRSRHI